MTYLLKLFERLTNYINKQDCFNEIEMLEHVHNMVHNDDEKTKVPAKTTQNLVCYRSAFGNI